MKNSARRAPRGMTLIEIMVVMVILAIIAAAVAVNVTGRLAEARSKQAQTDVNNIASQGIDAYKVMRGRYPTSDEGLGILIQEKFLKANSPDGKLKDPWGREYVYLNPGQVHADSYDVKSYGGDGSPGGTDENADVVNH